MLRAQYIRGAAFLRSHIRALTKDPSRFLVDGLSCFIAYATPITEMKDFNILNELTWVARYTRMREYEVRLICSCFSFGKIDIPFEAMDVFVILA